ncbi:MAG: FAD-dependent oxidoreductase [Planctomycetota bacterium]|jgi:hypothetical protein|nr:FAD-dependent oxidoreductase [Planctomycetota bacterium]
MTTSHASHPYTPRFDLVVVGATPSGIAAAIRAARCGLSVLLTQHNDHIGGMCSNGLGQWDAQSDHRRCGLFREILHQLEQHYQNTDDAGHVTYNVANYPVGSFASGTIEALFERMVAAEPTITLERSVIPLAVQREGRRIVALTLGTKAGDQLSEVVADSFIDATYEGDLLALAGAAYHVGREGFDEYGEPHAGRLFTGATEPAPAADASGGARVKPYGHAMTQFHDASPRSGDGAIQAYNLRPCLSSNPATRQHLDSPPTGYERERYVNYIRKYLVINNRCEGTASYNSPILPGANHAYPEADWATRDTITTMHAEFALGLMYFLQNDPSVPDDQRERHRHWGLASNEWQDNGHLPHEMYVREARRLRGRRILTEHDFTVPHDALRPPAFADSICFTDWYMDSHSCTHDGTYGADHNCIDRYPFDGKLILTDRFRPAMIPYDSLLPQELDNLIVSVCISTTHVAWGSVRLEPCWIHLGEVAGYAAALAKRERCTPGTLAVSTLQQALVASGASIAFLNNSERILDDPRRAEWELQVCHGEHTSFETPMTPIENP